MDPTNDGNNSSERVGKWENGKMGQPCNGVVGKELAVCTLLVADGMLRPPGRNVDYRSGFSQSECDNNPATPRLSLLTCRSYGHNAENSSSAASTTYLPGHVSRRVSIQPYCSTTPPPCGSLLAIHRSASAISLTAVPYPVSHLILHFHVATLTRRRMTIP